MKPATLTANAQQAPGARGGGTDDAEPTSWLLCRVGTVLCALPIEQVIEIMRPFAIEPVAGAPQYVLGVSIIRGVPVAVVDLGRIAGDRATRSERLIAVTAATRTIALAVDAVLGIQTVTADAFGQLPPVLRDVATDAISAMGARDTELIVFLRTARIVPDDVLARLVAEDVAS